MAEMNLKKLATRLSSIASCSSLGTKDLEALREIREGLTSIISSLKECDCCGAAVTDIARLEIDGVRAIVCPACGIKALKNQELVIKSVKKKDITRSHTTASTKAVVKTALKSKPFKTEPHPETKSRVVDNQPSLFGDSSSSIKSSKNADDMEGIATTANSKLMTVKKIHSIASGVAFPMNLERTLSFVRIEAQSQHLHLKEDEIKRVVVALRDKGLLRIKES